MMIWCLQSYILEFHVVGKKFLNVWSLGQEMLEKSQGITGIRQETTNKLSSTFRNCTRISSWWVCPRTTSTRKRIKRFVNVYNWRRPHTRCQKGEAAVSCPKLPSSTAPRGVETTRTRIRRRPKTPSSVDHCGYLTNETKYETKHRVQPKIISFSHSRAYRTLAMQWWSSVLCKPIFISILSRRISFPSPSYHCRDEESEKHKLSSAS